MIDAEQCKFVVLALTTAKPKGNGETESTLPVYEVFARVENAPVCLAEIP